MGVYGGGSYGVGLYGVGDEERAAVVTWAALGLPTQGAVLVEGAAVLSGQGSLNADGYVSLIVRSGVVEAEADLTAVGELQGLVGVVEAEATVAGARVVSGSGAEVVVSGTAVLTVGETPLHDTFTGANGTLLENHMADSGAIWTAHPDSSAGVDAVIQANRVTTGGGVGSALYYASSVPSDSDYGVEATLRCVTNTSLAGVLARVDTAAGGTGYILMFTSGTGWQLGKLEAGSYTVLATEALLALTDDFDDNSLDTVKWQQATMTGTGSVSEQNQRLEIAVAGGSFNAYDVVGNELFDLQSRRFSAEVDPGTLDAGHTTTLGVYLDANNSLELSQRTASSLRLAYRVAGVVDAVDITYDPDEHRWWRIGEAAGNILWDTSPDGVIWTNRRTTANPLALSPVYARLYASSSGAGAPGHTATFDNVSVSGLTLLTAGQDYLMRLDVLGDKLRGLVDGVEVVAVTDGAVTQIGKAGIRSAAGNQTATGYHIDTIDMVDALAVASLSGAGALTASGEVIAGNPSATLLGAGALVASGKTSVKGTAALTGTGSLTASGTVAAHQIVVGSAVLSGNGTLAAAGKQSIRAAATMHGEGHLLAMGGRLVAAELDPGSLVLVPMGEGPPELVPMAAGSFTLQEQEKR